jgi:quercetin dioxygenase-like cupin family protein
MAHYFGRFADSMLEADKVFAGHSQSYTRASLVNHALGSVMTGLSVCEIAPGGTLDPHVHSFEEGFYVLEGEGIFTCDGHSYRLKPGDYGVVKVGKLHAWRNTGTGPVRWLQMNAPQPKPDGKERDTFFQKGGKAPSDARPLDINDLRGNLLGHFDDTMIPPVGQRQNVAAGLEGVFLKWMIDENFGSIHHRMLYIEYQPGVSIGLHDHTFEEAYFLLSGEVQGVLDGKTYLAKPGDVLWTSVGCVHSFANIGTTPVRWLETFAPIPPKEDVFRFMANWDKRAKELEG